MERKARPEDRPVFRGKTVDLVVRPVRMADGETRSIEIVRHPQAAAIVPLLDDGDVVLVRQHRHPADRELLEVPAGKIDPGETPEDCAARELEEETGWRAGRLEPLGAIWSSPGFADERIWLFLATRLRRTEASPTELETIEVVRMPLAEAVEQAGDGRIDDGKSVCALLRADAFLERGA